WFNYKETRLGQGRDNAKEYLKANPELSADIEKQLRARSGELLMVRGGGKMASKKVSANSKQVDIDVEVED
ncbi:MAG: DNA recombination/repair protein RecA, partial [Hydrogenoanaerobacterium sp.]